MKLKSIQTICSCGCFREEIIDLETNKVLGFDCKSCGAKQKVPEEIPPTPPQTTINCNRCHRIVKTGSKIQNLCWACKFRKPLW